MPTLPAQVDADRRQREADQARAMMDPERVPGVFVCAYWRAADPSKSGDVRAKIAHAPAGPAAGGLGRVPAGSLQHRAPGLRLQVAAMGPDETLGANGITGSLGGVLELRPGDTLLAPGRAIGSGLSEVQLRVKDGTVRRTGGWWTAELSG